MFLCLLAFVASVRGQTNQAPALVPAYAELPPTFLEQTSIPLREHPAITSAGILILLALAALVAWQIFRRKPAPAMPPEKIARAALARLQAQPEDANLLGEVSRIFRRYVSGALGFAGGEMTTAEFCTAISEARKIETELSGAVAGFLRECDVRKFSPAHSAPPVDAVRRALELVAQIENETRRRDAGAPSA